MTRWLIAALLVGLLSVDGWGCGGIIDEYTPEPDEPVAGWCCDGYGCGLDADTATWLDATCHCAGVVRFVPGLIGECTP